MVNTGGTGRTRQKSWTLRTSMRPVYTESACPREFLQVERGAG